MWRRAWEALVGLMISLALAAISGVIFATLYFRQHGG